MPKRNNHEVTRHTSSEEVHRKARERKRRAECDDDPYVAVGAGRFFGVRRVSAGGDEMQGHATRRQVLAGVLWRRAECALGRTQDERGQPKAKAVA